MKKQRIALILLALAALIVLFAAYLGDYYHADVKTLSAVAASVSAHITDDGWIVCEPEEPKAGIIFYPGGKVEHTAYVPLMQALADKGFHCVLIKMPFHLAVLDLDAADGVQEKYPHIEHWYMAGHSLGGAMAASYLSRHTDAFDGLILLGAYSTADLSDTDLDVLSIYGSEDGVMNFEKYEANKVNLPRHFAEIVLQGGCHAGFGLYGPQNGDGTPAMTSEEQISQTAEAIAQNCL